MIDLSHSDLRISREDADVIVSRYDEDGDGKLSFPEFVEAMKTPTIENSPIMIDTVEKRLEGGFPEVLANENIYNHGGRNRSTHHSPNTAGNHSNHKKIHSYSQSHSHNAAKRRSWVTNNKINVIKENDELSPKGDLKFDI